MKQNLHLIIMLSAALSPTTQHAMLQKTSICLQRSLSKEKSFAIPSPEKKTNAIVPSITKEEELAALMTDPQTINKQYDKGETLLIRATRNGENILIKKLLTYDQLNINIQDDLDKTALHYAAQYKDKKIIKKLLKDARTDTSLVDKNKKTARDLIKGNTEQDAELRRMIFARIMLDWTINKESKLIDNNFKYFLCIATIDTTVKKIKDIILADENKQDHALPQSARLPAYADDEFIKKMFLLRLKTQH